MSRPHVSNTADLVLVLCWIQSLYAKFRSHLGVLFEHTGYVARETCKPVEANALAIGAIRLDRTEKVQWKCTGADPEAPLQARNRISCQRTSAS